MQPLRALIATLCLLCISAPAFAVLPPALTSLQSRGAVVGKSFPAPDGLTGWVVQIQGHTIVLYSTPGGRYLLSGALVDQGGNNLTEQYSDTYIEQPAANKLAIQLASDPLLVDEGDKHAPELYAYIDANCIYCNKLWTELRPYVQSGKLQVHWVVLAFLKDSSMAKGAAILAAPDRLAALTQDETKFDTQQEEGGVAPLDKIPPAITTAMNAHAAQMAESGSQGTPLLLYRKGTTWALMDGMPRDFQTFLNSVNPSIPPTPAR
ncbi:MAG TPA: thiol:disulfide interchange protein DsbG [Gammaproteobacteria bacterium]